MRRTEQAPRVAMPEVEGADPVLLEEDWPRKLAEAGRLPEPDAAVAGDEPEPEPERKHYVRVVDKVVVEGPVELPGTPDVFFSAAMPGEWVECGPEVCCHDRYEGGKFTTPELMKPPVPADPTEKLAAFLRDNPDVRKLVGMDQE